MDTLRAQTVNEALVDAAGRFVQLLGETERPQAKAIGRWSAAETAAHTVTVSYFDALSCGCAVDVPFGIEDLMALVETAAIEDVERLNALSLTRFQQRDLEALGEHIASNVGHISLASTQDPDAPAVWLGGMVITRRAVAGHLLGELLVHGYDIARSQDLPWQVSEGEANLAFEECYLPIIDAAASMIAGPGLKPVSIEFRTAPGRSTFIDVTDAGIRRRPIDGPADVVIASDPATTLLTMFERVHPVKSLLSGRLKVSGRRPWRIARMRKALSMP